MVDWPAREHLQSFRVPNANAGQFGLWKVVNALQLGVCKYLEEFLMFHVGAALPGRPCTRQSIVDSLDAHIIVYVVLLCVEYFAFKQMTTMCQPK
jgi:hypothetical protein